MSTRFTKIVGLRLKILLPQKVKLAGSLDMRHLSSEEQCLTRYISAVNRAIPDIFQWSIVRRNVYGATENRWSTAENAATAECQTCKIARCRHLSEKTMSTPASLRTSKRLQIDTLLLLRSNRKPGSGNVIAHVFAIFLLPVYRDPRSVVSTAHCTTSTVLYLCKLEVVCLLSNGSRKVYSVYRRRIGNRI